MAKRAMQFEKQTAILESANANLAGKLDACTQAGSALKKYANQLADLYHNAPCSYHSLDPDGVFLQINDTGLKWLGLTRKEVVGKMRFTDLLTPASGKIFMESYQRFKECGRLRNLQLETARRDGTSLPVLLYANAIVDASGRFVMSRSMLFDIADLKH